MLTTATQRVQTYEGLAQAFSPEQVQGVQEEVQLREQVRAAGGKRGSRAGRAGGRVESSLQRWLTVSPPMPASPSTLSPRQDFGNFQDAEGKKREKAERLR